MAFSTKSQFPKSKLFRHILEDTTKYEGLTQHWVLIALQSAFPGQGITNIDAKTVFLACSNDPSSNEEFSAHVDESY